MITIGMTAFAAFAFIGVYPNFLTCAVSFFSLMIVVWLMCRSLTAPLQCLSDTVVKIAAGERPDHCILKGGDELTRIAGNINIINDELFGVLTVMNEIAKGNFTIDSSRLQQNSKITATLNNMLQRTREMITNIKSMAITINTGADQISKASQQLSESTVKQASALQEINSSMTEIETQTKKNAENAEKASKLSTSNTDEINKNAEQMIDMMGAIGEIEKSSHEIAKVIKIIDDIAFQTNLLALNAAVEAARAGKHGKGFAVVAGEVRNLSVRSAKASRETADLIEKSVKNVGRGMDSGNKAADTLVAVVGESMQTTELIGEITTASDEQSRGISQVSIGLRQIDEAIQFTAANAEETSAATEELLSNSENLKKFLIRLRLGEEDGKEIARLDAGKAENQTLPLPDSNAPTEVNPWIEPPKTVHHNDNKVDTAWGR